jgi:hypothetical protein
MSFRQREVLESDDPFEGLDEFFTDDDLSLTSVLGAFSSKSGPSTSSEKAVFLQGFLAVAAEETARVRKPNIRDPPGAFSVAAKVNRFNVQFSCKVLPKSHEEMTRSKSTAVVNDARTGPSTEPASQFHLRTMTPQRHHALANSLARHICQMRCLNSETRKSTQNLSEDSAELSISEMPKTVDSLILSQKTTANQLIQESGMAAEDHVAEFEALKYTPLSHNLASHFSDMKQKRLNAKSRRVCVMEHLPSLSLEDTDHGSTVSSITDTKLTDASEMSSLEEGSEGSSERTPVHASSGCAAESNTMVRA